MKQRRIYPKGKTMFKKLWNKIDGKKTFIGSSGLIVGVGAFLGIDQNDVSTIINQSEIVICSILMIVGLIHKIIKKK